ncbi:MAG: hypothetical protein ACR2K2_07130 [Mycobacteriales bacterium]
MFDLAMEQARTGDWLVNRVAGRKGGGGLPGRRRRGEVLQLEWDEWQVLLWPQPLELVAVQPLIQVGRAGGLQQGELVGLLPVAGVGEVVDRARGGVQVQRQPPAAAQRSPQRAGVSGHHDRRSAYPVPAKGPRLLAPVSFTRAVSHPAAAFLSLQGSSRPEALSATIRLSPRNPHTGAGPYRTVLCSGGVSRFVRW